MYADEALKSEALKLVASLRRAGKKADFSYKGGALGKQLKQASAVNAAMCIIVGDEFVQKKQIAVKNMDSGEQSSVDVSEFFGRL